MARDKKKQDDPVNYYDGIIAAYERAFKTWEGRGKKIVDRYRDEQRAKQDNDQTKFNILWSNVNTLVPACYSRVPQPDVARRFRDQDPVGRVASLLLERGLQYEIEHYPDYKATMRQAVQDRFLPGRGTAWVRYEPHFKPGSPLPSDGLQITEDQETEDEPEQAEQIDYECAPTDYVHWRDFGHNIARTWEEVYVVWRKVYMYEEGVAERFGDEVAKTLTYDAMPTKQNNSPTTQDTKKQAIIYEIWDKQKKGVCWMTRSQAKTMLDERDDPLGLQEFFPCPLPLFATTTNDSLIPVPDFALYQDQARELDIIADRIDGLVRMLQVKGCYDAATPELARLFTEGTNGTLLPIKNYAAFAEKNGLGGAIDIVELKPIYEAINVCFESAREIINFIYQITGISDIVRGQSEAGETLGAQQLKVNFVGLRLGEMKKTVAQFATDLLRFKAQIICQHFSPQTILAIGAAEQLSEADQQYLPQALELLIGRERLQNPEADSPNPLRSFRIEVNADSLVQLDEQAEKEAAKDMLGGIARFLESAGAIGAQAPQMVPVLMELLKWSLTKYKVGKTIEGTIDQALEKMKQDAVAAAAQPKEDPAVQAEQAKAKAAQEKAQLDVGVAKQKAQIDQQGMQAQQQHDQAKLSIEGQRLQMEGQRMAMEQQMAQAQHQQRMQQAAMPPQRPQGRPQ